MGAAAAGHELDHIAIAARDLDEGARWLRDLLGVEAEAGGRHPLMGTHNLLLSLGPREYLEIIAIDPDAPPPARRRWFGLDGFDGPPRLAGWVVRARPLTAPAGTTIAEASRGDLRWRITLPEAGQMPDEGAQPILIDWHGGAHPCDRLADRGLRLAGLCLPLDRMPLADPRLSRDPRFGAIIATPGGPVRL
ncbi:VOC family protein [Paracoccus spongiarum]|uniref:VOC family protein n=1 Tax=Paracoccus spongiarum TaxID=3064387 RepID=A0ABT9J7J3_9RHOB|nr:VOC family protein [Paracoccus sp. 2205BS29-5]MDP5305778.1 VOC family protein [Paracoccus sp. 2205BS29-5]